MFSAQGSGTIAKGALGTDSFTGMESVEGCGGNDRITGFAGATLNTFEFVASGFAGLAAGQLDPDRFFASPSGLAAPGTTGPSVCYDTQTGLTVFDENGRDEGGRYVLAHLWGAPVLTAGDIGVIG